MTEIDEKILELNFNTESIQDNLSGWGPCDLPDTFKDMPYQPFSKSDRIGKICDWTNSGAQDKKFTVKYASVFGSAGQYAYYHDNDENSFHLVDTTKVQKPPHQRNRMRPMQRNVRGRGGNRGGYQQSNMQMLSKGVKPQQRDRKPSNKKWGQGKPQVKNRESSVTVKNDWITVEEMDFPRLSKLTLPGVKEGETIVSCGELLYYDKTYDRVNVKNELPLKRIDRIFHTVTTTDDPIIRKLSKTDIGNVFATDTILATIMCSTRSNYSWDIVIEKIGGKLFFDKRDNTEFDLLSVNETANEPPQEDASSINSPRSLALEATFINHNFSQQVLKSGENDPRYKLKEKNPFISEEEETEVASVAYYYKKWDLSNGITLVARCELDAVTLTQNGETQFLTIKALNEWDPKLSNGVDWRQKLDTQRGAVLANELRNNANKLAKWTVQAILAGCDQIKFGYVSRVIVRDANKHVILGTQQYKPQEFSTQINLNMDNAWGILRCIIDMVRKQKDGKYLIMKDPNKCIIRLYDIPDNTFDSENESSSEDEEQNAAIVA